MKNTNPGTLYIVATPIGNLQDITFRAIEVLKQVDCIVAEDTRHSQPLLQHYHISKPIISLHEHNERERAGDLLKRLQQGESIALISDAGTPLISDPGYSLAHQARELGLTVTPIPGACAVIAALSAAGLPTDRFTFEGFLPAKSQARINRLNELKNESRTMVFYEAPHRILDFFNDLQKVLGETRKVVLARELTKFFETIRLGSVSELIAWMIGDTNQQRGEMVVIVAGAEASISHETMDLTLILSELLKHLPLKVAVDIAVKITGNKKNAVYNQALQIKND